MRRVRRRLAIGMCQCLVGVAALTLGLAGLVGRADAEEINACVNTVNGQVRIVAQGTVCKPVENAIAWNITGPAGAAGPAGPVGLTGAVGPAGATGPAGPAGNVFAFTCPPDSVRSGRACIDKYEASVWQTTDPSTIAKIKDGTVILADLTAGGATQRGLAFGDLVAAGCPYTGNGCTNVYAVSIPGVTPSRILTWFQAAAAARNAGKRLPSNAEWQAAALGTPDGAPCNVSAGGLGPTGTAGCVSDVGAFDMVGNLWEWVADWVPRSTACVTDLFGTGDSNCLAGADTTFGPGLLIRGGMWGNGTGAGVFAVHGGSDPSLAFLDFGFRCAR